MGLSSSQARLLNLTARMHQIEYKAAKLEAQKLQMANESRRVYDDYLVALDKTKVQIKTLNNTGSFDYIDATYNNLIAAGYAIDFVGFNQFIKPIEEKTSVPEGYIGIYDAAGLLAMADNLSGNYILMADIDLSGIEWTGIGTSANMFCGTFDGNGHVIRNLTGSQGLFGRVRDCSEIKNVGLENVNINGTGTSSHVGALAGQVENNITIDNCYATGNITSDGSYTAGLVGFSVSPIDITNSYSACNVTGGSHVAGIIAQSAGAHINLTNCFAYGSSNSGLLTVMDSSHVSATNSYNIGGSYNGIGHSPVSIDTLRQISNFNVNPIFGHENDSEWLTNMINAGEIIITKSDKKGSFYETSVAIDTGLQEVSDETLLRKAEAKYEADMRKIDAKDRKFDADLAALDAERNAIKSEMETLKTVAKDNVERTFKLFS